MKEKGTANRSTFGDKYGATQFHQELPKLALEDVIGNQYLVKEVRIVEGFMSKFGKSDFALLLLENEAGELATTLCGGAVVVDKLRKAINDGALPLYGTLSKVESGEGNEYYDIN